MMLSIRVDDSVTERLDRIVKVLTERASGVPVTRAAAMRLALERGMVDLEAEINRKPKK